MRNQKGSVLIIALILVAAVSILASSILYLIKIKIVQNNAISRDNDITTFSLLSVKDTKNQLAGYTNTPSNSSFDYSLNSYSSTVTYAWQNIYPDSRSLYNASAYLQYLLTSTTTNASTGRTVEHKALLNFPSQYRLNSGLTPKVSQEVNIPIIILNNLISSQKNSSDTINTGQSGYIGTIETDNINQELIYTPHPSTDPQSFSLSFPTVPGPSQTFQLYQGWGLSSGEWILYYFLQSSAKAFYFTSISLSNLLSDPNAFSSLTWSELILGPGASLPGPSPCPGARKIKNTEDILSAHVINNYDSIHMSLFLKDTNSGQITGYTYDMSGCDSSTTYNYGSLPNIVSIYTLATDFHSNQSVSNILLFMSETSGLKYIHNTEVSSATLVSDTSLYSFLTITGSMAYPPQLMPKNSEDDFLIIPYDNHVEIYTYTRSPVSISLLHTITGLTGDIIKIIPVNGFIIILTNTPNAHFFSLFKGDQFKSYSLTSDNSTFITYSNPTQEVVLHTSSDSININNAPMPYGVIGMQ